MRRERVEVLAQAIAREDRDTARVQPLDDLMNQSVGIRLGPLPDMPG